MRGRGLAVAALVAFAASAEPAHAEQLTVYSSLPLSGASKPQSQAIVRGARLALEESGGVAGAHQITYVSLNDATRRAGAWTPQRVSRNARKAGQDESAIAYIGEFNSGATAISLPILNEVGIAQISPTNTAIGLTRDGPGADFGEPDKYYPTGELSYFRIAPNDRVQGGALAAAMRDRGCRRVASLSDAELYGDGVAAWTRRHAKRLGLRIVLARKIRRYGPRYRGLARRVRRARPDCLAFSGITANGAVPLFRALARRLPKADLFGSDGIGESGFTDPREGGVPARVGRRVLITISVLPPAAYPPAGQDFFRRYGARYGDATPDPYAVHGYEAMRLCLDAVAAAGANRSAVIAALRALRDRDSVLGTYGFDRFGDTTLRTFGLYGIRGGSLTYAGAVQAP
jgi:branched-chain amino acid transport system substrate-binding protein